jgi:hypothetical protein
MQGLTATHHDPQWDTGEKAPEAGNTQLTGHFRRYWQVLGSAQQKRGQRFTEPLVSLAGVVTRPVTGLLRLERSPVIPGRGPPQSQDPPGRRVPPILTAERRPEVPLERAADAAGGSPRRLVQGGGPHRVRMARPAVTDPLPAGPTPVTGNGPSVYLRRTWRVPRRSAQVRTRGQICASPAQSQPRGQGGEPVHTPLNRHAPVSARSGCARFGAALATLRPASAAGPPGEPMRGRDERAGIFGVLQAAEMG